ncbi:DHS-like NAD/FAD-binding domain-containing protein [Parathielavia appendiculata]|uniref:DHS-like NAD/FAD-binding domain-containing protein n=1 Tax=Parathielavia appendiculata TaxID=2587402 RepID=A0AAN6TRC6_9PEZI|nr:DHS-like NAD/FAD-binding domain-containing protein [Parathielavia appendiculata]
MPTTHVAPDSGSLLQDIANTLWKSRKVVVITGAGISTNSGIPDFRSENGLYSLIQAQFEAAQQIAAGGGNVHVCDASVEQRPAKRQRRAHDDSDRRIETHEIPFPGLRNAAPKTLDADRDQESRKKEEPCDREPNGALPSPSSESGPIHDGTQSAHGMTPMEHKQDATVIAHSTLGSLERLANTVLGPRKIQADYTKPDPPAVEATAPFASSPPTLTLGTPRSLSKAHLFNSPPESSSPLSSPPHIIFDPYSESADCSSSQDTESSCSQSEGSSSASTPVLSSQTSFASSRATLPIMKGRDLFDAQIWSCPIKTSVFYTFVSTLRDKVRSAEPTESHRFLSVLRDSRKLVRCYTQNIDQLEERVGLSTSLSLGVGSRYRFSARAGRNSGAAKGLRSADAASEANQGASPQEEEQRGVSRPQEKPLNVVMDGLASGEHKLPPLRPSQTRPDTRPTTGDAPSSTPSATAATSAPAAPNRGVECVFLHGSLAELRCFVCARTASWEEDTRLADTLAGQQPTCPHCAGATAAREERGKRALGVGKLRPDIVLYGEEHPQAHLISPLIQHDLSLGPDMLLILGTSMRVHGLKVLVKEFAKAVHDRGGRVVFVNFTKPPESVWADIIDYWVEWDCDAWVSDLQQRKPALWLPPGAVLPEVEKPKTSKLPRRQSGAEPGKRKEGADKSSKKLKEADRPAGFSKAEDIAGIVKNGQAGARQCQQPQEMPRLPSQPTPPKAVPRKPPKVPKELKLNPDAKRPASIRDHKLNGAYLVWKIMKDLRRITGESPTRSTDPSSDSTPARPKARKPRRSAPAALGFPGMPVASSDAAEENRTPIRPTEPAALASFSLLNTGAANRGDEVPFRSDSSISTAVKTRKRKQAVTWRMIGGVETRVSLDTGGEPETPSLPHATAFLHPLPVPESRRLPPPTPTTPQLPHQQPLTSVPRPQAALPNHVFHPQSTAPNPKASVIDQAIDTGFRETDRLIAQFQEETRLSRPATPSSSSSQTQPQTQLRLPSLSVLLKRAQDHYRQPDMQLRSHLQQLYPGRQPPPHGQPRLKLTPLEPRVESPGPRKVRISSDVGSPVVGGTRTADAGHSSSGYGQHDAFFFADPLVGWLGSPPVWAGQKRQCQQQHYRLFDQRLQRQQQQRQQQQVEEAAKIIESAAAVGAGAWEPEGTAERAGMMGTELGTRAVIGGSDSSLPRQQRYHQALHQQQIQSRQQQQHGHDGYTRERPGREMEEQGSIQGLLGMEQTLEYQYGTIASGWEDAHHGEDLVLELEIGDLSRVSEEDKEIWRIEHPPGDVDASEERGSGSWCPEEQLRKEQEAAMMLSSLRGSAG